MFVSICVFVFLWIGDVNQNRLNEMGPDISKKWEKQRNRNLGVHGVISRRGLRTQDPKSHGDNGTPGKHGQ